MMKKRYSVGVYTVKTDERILVKVDPMRPLSSRVFDLVIKFGLTPKMPSEKNKPLFTLTLQKFITDSQNKNLVNLTRTYTYLLDIDDTISPTEAELFDLFEDSAKDFAIEFSKLVRGTIFQHHRVAKPNKDELLVKLEKAIDFWDDSIRNIKVDKNGKPLDNE